MFLFLLFSVAALIASLFYEQRQTGYDDTERQRQIRYTRHLSEHLQRYVLFPAELVESGQVTGRVGVVINRAGEVLEVTVIDSTGQATLDAAMLDAAYLADPLPAVPEWYQSEQPALRFMFPVKFGK